MTTVLDTTEQRTEAVSAAASAAAAVLGVDGLTVTAATPDVEPGDRAVVASLSTGGRICVLLSAAATAAVTQPPADAGDLVAASAALVAAAASALGAEALATQEVAAEVAVPEGAFGAVAAAAGERLLCVAIEFAAAEAVTAQAAEFPQLPLGAPSGAVPAQRIELLSDVSMAVTVELGRTRMTVRELLSLTPGVVVELDRAAGSPVDLFVNGRLIAHGEVVVIDEEFAVRITDIIGTDAPGSGL